MFTPAIILKKLSTTDKRQGWRVLTREYGKIDLWIRSSKKDPCLDIGSLIAFTSDRKNEVNVVRSWYLTSHLTIPSTWGAQLALEALSLLALIEKIAPPGESNCTLYEDILSYREALHSNASDPLLSRLLVLRLVIHSGILDASLGRSSDCERVCRWLQNASALQISRLRGVDESLALEIDRLAHTSLTQYIHV